MITDTTNYAIYKGDGKRTFFQIPFPFTERDHIVVELIAKDNTSTIITSDYYVDTSSKAVIYPGYVPGEEKEEVSRPPILTREERILIYREIPCCQESELGDKTYFNEIESGMDKLTMIDQTWKATLERCMKLSKVAIADGYDATLPYPKNGQMIIWHNGKLSYFKKKKKVTEVQDD